MSQTSEKLLGEFLKMIEKEGLDISEKRFVEAWGDIITKAVEELEAGNKDREEIADELFQLSQAAPTKKGRTELLKKVLEFDKNNLDAESKLIEYSSSNVESRIKKYQKLIEKATKNLEREGWFEYEGEFWGFIETRPYMRLRFDYMWELLNAGKMRMAAQECEEMLRLSENDNLGVRYHLMFLWVLLEEEDELLDLYERYPEEGTHFLLAFSMLYYKLNEMKKAEEYIARLVKVNPDTVLFFRDILEDRLYEYVPEILGAYRPDTMEEFLTIFQNSEYLFLDVHAYLEWGKRTSKKWQKNERVRDRLVTSL
ncbi:MAG: hypothetical protein Q3993_01335 [Filifactor alocis]|nr:hypothetical protein [Filifactor alocis]